MPATVFRLKASVGIRPDERATYDLLYPSKPQHLEFAGELTRSGSNPKEWNWTISGGGMSESGTILSSGIPTKSALGLMKAAARHGRFSHASPHSLIWHNWVLKEET